MNPTTILKAHFPASQEDLQRFAVELSRNEDGQPVFVVTYLSKKTNVKENYKDFRLLLNSMFKVPSVVYVHTEDVVKEQAVDNKKETTIDVVEATLNGADLEA